MQVLFVALMALASSVVATEVATTPPCEAPLLRCLNDVLNVGVGSFAVEVSTNNAAGNPNQFQPLSIDIRNAGAFACFTNVKPANFKPAASIWVGPAEHVADANIYPWTYETPRCAQSVPCGDILTVKVTNLIDKRERVITCPTAPCPASPPPPVSSPPPAVSPPPPYVCPPPPAVSPPPPYVCSPPPPVTVHSPPPYVCSPPPPVTVHSPPPYVCSPPPPVTVHSPPPYVCSPPPPVTVHSPPPAVCSPPPYCAPWTTVHKPPPYVCSPPPYCAPYTTVHKPPPYCAPWTTVHKPPPYVCSPPPVKVYSPPCASPAPYCAPVTAAHPPKHCAHCTPVTVAKPPPKYCAPVTIYKKPPPSRGSKCGVTKWGKPVYCKKGQKCCTIYVKKWYGKKCKTTKKQQCMKRCPKY